MCEISNIQKLVFSFSMIFGYPIMDFHGPKIELFITKYRILILKLRTICRYPSIDFWISEINTGHPKHDL